MTAQVIPTTAPTLAALRPGVQAVVDGLSAALHPQTARRLRDLGFRPGTIVEMVRRAPLGDPCVYRVRNYDLCLRRREAAMIQLRPCVDEPEAPVAE